MSRSNPIYYVDVTVSGPHGDFPWTQVEVWVHRANGLHEYMASAHGGRLISRFRYTRGIAMMNALLARLIPGIIRREVVYVQEH